MKYNGFLLATISAVLVANDANASLAFLRAAKQEKKVEIIEKTQTGQMDEELAIQLAGKYRLGDIRDQLTPKDWAEFFLQTADMDYAALLDGADKLSRNDGTFKAEIAQVTASINGETLLDWLETWRDAAFGGILTDTTTHRKKINRLINAVKARDAFAHLGFGSAIISKAVFENIDGHDGVTLKGAYAAHIGDKVHRNVNMTNVIATDVVDNRRTYDAALKRAKVAPEAAYWTGLNRGFSDNEAREIADRIINHEDAEAAALQRVIQAKARFNALNPLTVAQRVLAGRTLDQAHRDLTVAATKVNLDGRFANVEEEIRTAMSERMYDANLGENAALRAILNGLENTGLKHSNNIPNLADAMLNGVDGVSREDAAEALEKAYVEGTIAIGNLHYLQNNDALIFICMNSDTINAGIRLFCSSVVGDDLAEAFETHLKAHNGVNFVIDDEKVSFYRTHVRTRLNNAHNNLSDEIKGRIATALAAANTPAADITEQVVAAALVAEDAVAYGGGNAAFGRAIAVKLLSEAKPNLVAATRLARIDMKAEEIRARYGHIPLEERLVLATNFVDNARGNVDEASMKLALAAYPNVDALDLNALADFQEAVLGGRTIENALEGNIAAVKNAITEYEDGAFAHIVGGELELLAQKFVEIGKKVDDVDFRSVRQAIEALFAPSILKTAFEKRDYWARVLDNVAPKGLVAAFTVPQKRLYDIGLKERKIETFKAGLNLAMRRRIAEDFVDENRGNVENDSLRAALVHLMTPLTLGNMYRDFYIGQILNDGADLADLLDSLREKLLWDDSFPLLATYENVDTLLAYVPDELNGNEQNKRIFAKMLHEETLRLDNDVSKKIKATLQLCAILRDAGVDLTDVKDIDMRAARTAREEIYKHRRFLVEEAQKKQARIEARRLDGEIGLLDVPQPSGDMQDVNLFVASLNALKTALPGGEAKRAVGFTFEAAFKAWTFKHNLELDSAKYGAVRAAHHNSLAIQVVRGDDIIFNQDWNGPKVPDVNVDLRQERIDALTQLQLLDHNKRNDGLKLNYVNFTIEDNLSYILAAKLPTVNTDDGNEYRQLQARLDTFLDRYADNTPRYRFGVLQKTIRQQNKDDLESAFNRFAGGNDNWSGKIYALLTRVPENLVAPDVVRPTPDGDDDLPGYNADAWQNALDEQTYLVFQDVIGCNIGCDTGANRKLDLVLSARAAQMGLDKPELSILQKVASVKLGLKEARIEEMGRQYDYEETIVQTTQVARQRMKAIFSLPGDYTETPYARMGGPGQLQNQPEQIIRNLFVENQPNRVRNADNYDQVDYLGRPREAGTAVAPHLTVKRYLEAVHAKFDADDFLMMRNSIPEALIDYRLRETTQYDAGYGQHKSASAFFDDEGRPTLALTALFMDKIGEITILPAVKAATFTRVSDVETLNEAENRAIEDGDDFDSTAYAYQRNYNGRTLLDLIDDF